MCRASPAAPASVAGAFAGVHKGQGAAADPLPAVRRSLLPVPIGCRVGMKKPARKPRAGWVA